MLRLFKAPENADRDLVLREIAERVAFGRREVAAVPDINAGREQRGAAAGGNERAGGEQEQQKLIRSDNPSVRTVHRFSFAIDPSTKSLARA